MKFKKIGMRNLKTALSVALCVGLMQSLKRQDVFYAAVAAVIAMQSSVSDSFKAGKNRMLGTTFGAFIGLIFALLHPENAMLCGIGIIIIIYVCDLLDWNKSIAISCTVFLIIMLNLNGRSPVSYSVNRVIDTFIGIMISVLVNYFISPPKHLDKIYMEYSLAIDKVFELVRSKFCMAIELDLKSLQKEISVFEKVLRMYLSEFRVKQVGVEINRINKILEICKEIYVHLEIISDLGNDFSVNYDNFLKMKELFNYELDYSENHNDLGIVYNYHVSRVMRGLCALKELNTKLLYSSER